jgi:hypothetical protein
LENTARFSARLRGVQTLILDEGDQLLAQGFMPEIKRILGYLGGERQTLCFSATIPPELAGVLGVALRADHASVNCVGEAAADTHARVPQSYAMVPSADTLAAVARLIRAEQKEDPLAKIIVFYTTARQTLFGAEALNALGVGALEIHSRKSQSKRDAAAGATAAAAATDGTGLAGGAAVGGASTAADPHHSRRRSKRHRRCIHLCDQLRRVSCCKRPNGGEARRPERRQSRVIEGGGGLGPSRRRQLHP